MLTFENTHNGYAVDQNGKRHYSIHPGRGRNGHTGTETPRRTSGHLAKARKALAARRLSHANLRPKTANENMWKTPGSMKWK